MVMGRQLIDRGNGGLFLVCIITAFIFSGYLFAGTEKGRTAPVRTRIFLLKNISAAEGKKYLSRVGIDTISQIPNSNTLLVTAQQQQLLRASAVLRLVDSTERFNINTIFPVLVAKSLPPNEKIEAETGILIGTFARPPEGRGNKAIIDVYEDSVLAIASTGDFERILGAIERLQDEEAKLQLATEDRISVEKLTMAKEKPDTNEPVKIRAEQQKVESDLFGEILDGLVLEAEKEAEKETLKEEAKKQTQQQVLKQREVKSPEKIKADESVDSGIRELVSKVAAKTRELSSDKPVTQKVVVELRETEKIETSIERRSYKPKDISYDDDMLDLDLPEKLPIGDLLRLMGEYLHLDYMYDAAKVKGDVTLKLRGPIKVKDLYPLLESVLKFRGFVMTRKGNLVTIVPKAEVLDIDPVFIDAEKGQIEVGDILVTRIFELKHIDTASAKNLLTGMKLGTHINPIEATGTLIVTGYAYRMERIEELLEMIDKPGETKEFRFRQLRYTMAKTLTPSLKTLAEQLGTVSITVSAPAAAPKPKRGRKKPTPKKKTAAPSPKDVPGVYLEADERTNRILMIGLKAQLDTVEQLIDALDVKQQDLRRIRVYDIQYVGAEEVREKLSELEIIGGKTGAGSARITGRPKSKAKPATPTSTPRAGTEPLAEEPQVVIIDATNSLLVNATEEQHIRIATIISYVDSEMLEESIPYRIYSLENQDPEDMATTLNKLIKETVKDKKGKIEKVASRKDEDVIIIVPDKNTFSIIVYASQKNQRWIANLIKTLDKRRPQVLIDVMLVEITRDDIFQYDLDAISSFPDLLTTSGLTGVASIGTGIMGKLAGAHRDRFIDFSSSGGMGKGFYGDEHIQALLTLMQQKKYGRVLAQPKILVNDNETGTINTQTTTYVARTSSTATAAGDTVVSSTTTFDEFTSGIDLEITPHISEGELLRLEIKMSRSEQKSAEGAETNKPPPNKKENNIETVVTVPDKSTIILGGMQQLSQDKGGNKVPFFGDIPLIGGLFRSIDNTNSQSKLYIFVKAYILRPSETGQGLPDLVRESKSFRAAFEKSEREFQEYEEWPGRKSPLLDPLKILDVR